MKKFKLITILCLAFIFISVLYFFEPIKTNFVYNKELVFSDDEFTESNYEVNGDKILKKAEEYLGALFGDNFSNGNYHSFVSFDNYPNHDVASVLFSKDNSKKFLSYAINFDIYSGEVTAIYNSLDNINLSSNSEALSEDKLKTLATDGLSKITKYSKDDFILKSSLRKNSCHFSATIKGFDKQYSIELDLLSGSILSYNIL